ncbi:MAG TPA: DUF4265 domain-containing protein, partial [Candidatus Angelobacter sp.]
QVAVDRFRILNSPFFVFGVSADDIVVARPEGGVFKFQSVFSRSGHSTYRVFLQGDCKVNDPDFQVHWKPIAALGSTFENANGNFVAVDVPPGKDVAAVYRALEAGEEAGIWAFEEGHYGGQTPV